MKYFLSACVIFASLYFLPVVSSQTKTENETPIEEKTVTITAKGRGFPHINFDDGAELSIGANRNSAAAKLLTSADFDSDGTADLMVADAGGNLKFYRGNVDSIYPNSPEAVNRKALGNFNADAFYPSERDFALPLAPDYLEAGDFNADGFQDILAARKGDGAVYFLRGDGAGNFAEAEKISFEGKITALEVGEIGRRDGQTDLAVAVSGKDARILVFEHPEGAFKHKPEIIKLSAQANDLAIGNLDEDFFADIAVASGNKLTVVHGRGQAYPWDLLKKYNVKRPAAIAEMRVLPYDIAALEIGYFADGDKDSLAILTTNGNLQTLNAPKIQPTELKKLDRSKVGKSENMFLPSGIDARNRFASLKFTKSSADSEQNPNLLPVNREEREKFLRERGEKFVEEFTRPSDESQKQKTLEKNEAAKRNFLKTIAAKPSTPLKNWNLQTLISDARLANAASQGSEKLVRARVADSDKDDLVLADEADKQIHVVSPATKAVRRSRENPEQKISENIPTQIASFDSAAAPNAVLPMRLNQDGLSDLVVLREGSSAPSVVMTAPVATFVVNSNEGSSACGDASLCTLGGAILASELTPGADLIVFNMSGTTISPAGQLPAINTTVTLDATTQPGFNGSPVVEIVGTNAGSMSDGISVNGANSVVRGFAVNRFKSEYNDVVGGFIGGNGIVVFNYEGESRARNIIIEGNFLGTDTTGTQDLGNESAGINVFDSDNNLIGGTVPAARNLMSGNGSNNDPNAAFRVGVGLNLNDGKNTLVKGNYIGTNALGMQRINNTFGVLVATSNSELGGNEAGAGNLISGNGDATPTENDPNECRGQGVFEQSRVNIDTFEWVTANNNYKGNLIGITSNGSAPLGNCGTGIQISPRNTPNVGSIAASGRNTISGNGEGAVFCSPIARGFSPGSNVGDIEVPEGFCNIAGNNIGTDVSGTAAIPNEDDGGGSAFGFFFGIVVVYNTDAFSNVGAPGGTSPTTCTGFCNLVSGNTEDQAIHRGSQYGLVGVFNNFIGTNKSGSAALPNYSGVNVFSAGDTVIGGIGVEENSEIPLGNVISGNRFQAIALSSGSNYAEYGVFGNLIGTDSSGLNAVPNGFDPDSTGGAVLVGTGFITTFIGSSDNPLARNIISGNGSGGILIAAEIGVDGATFVDGNYIGVNRNAAPLGNASDGITINTRNSFIGRNIIAHNEGVGVFIRNLPGVPQSRNNLVRLNSIYGNGGLGIDLTADTTRPILPDGVTPNDCLDVDELANRLQNYPVLTAPVFNGNGTVSVEGAFQSQPSTDFVIDFYANSTADASGFGEGEIYIGSKTVRTGSDGITTFLFTSLETVAANLLITATATDPSGNTSEFSCIAGQCEGGTGGLTGEAKLRKLGEFACVAPIVVTIDTDESDSSPENGVCDVDLGTEGLQCSLRAAIETAQGSARPGKDLIFFDIPGGGIKIINTLSALPTITEAVIIEATTQNGYGGTPLIDLRGDGAGKQNGLTFGFGSDGSGVYGMAINRFLFGIGISAASVSVEKCYLGLNADGTPGGTLGQQTFGVVIQSNNAANNRIGGTSDESQNIISNNTLGIVLNQGASQNFIYRNKIGTNAAGTASIPNEGGIVLENAKNNFIGSAENGNLISGNSVIGVDLNTNSENNTVAGNKIGTKNNGTEVLPNGLQGIVVRNQAKENKIESNIVGGQNLGEFTTGILITDTAGLNNSIAGNRIGVAADGTPIPNRYGIAISADGQTIGEASNENIIGHNEKAGIWLTSASDGGNEIVENNIVENNYVGTDGTNDFGNGDFGIWLNGNVQNNRITNNIVSGNEGFGIALTDGAKSNRISLNFIGTNANGTSAISNGGGIWIRQSSNNQIELNLVSGNFFGILVGTGIGVEEFSELTKNYSSPKQNLGTEYTSGNQIFGNVVGLNAARSAAIPNNLGVAIGENARNNFIGSTNGAYNLVSGNTNGLGYGIFLGTLAANPSEDALPQFNTFQGNVVGLDGTLQTTISNKVGFVLLNAARNTIGGSSDLSANTIVASTEEGISIRDNSRENTFLKNYLGVLPPDFLRAARKSNPNFVPNGVNFGNGGNGISISNGAAQNRLGGSTTETGLIISKNGGSGIALFTTAGNNNLIGTNRIFGNNGLGIDLAANGFTPNDPLDADSGPNNLQNYPEIVSRQIVNDELIVGFKVDSAPENSAYGANGIYVEFFKADSSGEGERFLGSAFYTLTDYNSLAPGVKTVNLGNINTLGINANDPLTATATDANGNTSEFTPFAPTAAAATVSGKVTANGESVVRARVILTDSNGRTRTVFTNSFGFYSFENVAVGETFVFNVTAKQYTFNPRILTVSESLTDFDFEAQ